MVADPQVLAVDLVEVVERGAGYGRAGHVRRSEVRDGGERPGSPDVRNDVLQDGLDLLGRILVGNRPAGRPGHHAEASLLVEPIDLHDHAVGLVVETVTALAPLLEEGDHALDLQVRAVIRVHGEAERREARERVGLGGHRGDADPDCQVEGAGPACRHCRRGRLLVQLVGPEAETAPGRDGRIELAKRTGPAVAGVGVERQPGLLPPRVDPGELGLRHVDLAASLQRRGLGEAIRDRRDRAQVRRHILAGRPIAARRPAHEPPVAVAEADREPVDLELDDVAQLRGRRRCERQPQAPPDPGVERAQLVLAERVRQAEHRAFMPDLGKRAALVERSPRPDPLRGRVGRREGGKRRFERDELPEQDVVVGVGQGRIVIDVVGVVGCPDLGDERRVSCRRSIRPEGCRGSHERGVDGQVGRGHRDPESTARRSRPDRPGPGASAAGSTSGDR